MRIAILHSDANIIQLFSYIISELNFNMCWNCHNEKDAIRLCEIDCPDLLLMQLNLAGTKASILIKQIMASTPTTIIVISDSVKQNPGDVFEAMSAGALDALTEPSTDNPNHLLELKNKISNIKKLHDSVNRINRAKQVINATPLVAIGASTGGPAAVLTILKNIPENSNAIWVVIQHMDDEFSQGMAQWLNDQVEINVEIAIHSHAPVTGHVYIASTNDHLIINSSGCFEYTEIPVDYPYRPSVDSFFESALMHWPNKLIGVLLTGMGRDGANGLLSLYNRGMLTIAQDQASCAVYGMPKAACEINAVSIELDINNITKKIMDNLKQY